MDKLKVDIQAMEDAYAAPEKAKDADGWWSITARTPLVIIEMKNPFRELQPSKKELQSA